MSFSDSVNAVVYLAVFGMILLAANLVKPYYKRWMGDTNVPDLLSDLNAQYRVYNDVVFPLKHSPRHIDHIVLSVYGIFVIRTMSYNGIIKGNDNDRHWSNTVLLTTTVLENPVIANKRDAADAAALLGCGTGKIIPMVVFSNAAILKGNNDHCVINMTDMMKNIKKHKDVLLSSDEFERCSYILEQYASRAHRRHEAVIGDQGSEACI